MADDPIQDVASTATSPASKRGRGMALHTKILIGMAIGVLGGLLVGPNSPLLEKSAVELTGAVVLDAPQGIAVAMAQELRRGRLVDQQPGWLKIEGRLSAAALLRLQAAGVAAAGGGEPGMTVGGWVADESGKIRRFAPLGQRLVDLTEWIGRLFLALIRMVVVPLVFFSLVVGVASLGDFRKLGRLGGRTLAYFTGTTVVALVIGVSLANLVAPGKLLSAADSALLQSSYSGPAGSKMMSAAAAPSLVDHLVSIVPTNPVAALAGGDMLQVIFFALMLGIALTFLDTERARPVVELFDRLNDAMVMLVHIAMALAPYGVAALLFKVVGSTGFSVLVALSAYTGVVLLGLLLHLLLTFGTVIRMGVKLPFLSFLGAIKEAVLVGFSTSSSSATLPITKECCEDNLGISPQVSSFVLPIGATVNMDGTALYQGVAAIFIAQIYGMDLGLAEQATIVASATLASVGAAGVPGAGMITLALVLTAIGVPTEGLALVLGVDRLLDMFRTALNIIGDATATALMARLEGEDLRILSDAEDSADPRHGFAGRLSGGPRAVSLPSDSN